MYIALIFIPLLYNVIPQRHHLVIPSSIPENFTSIDIETYSTMSTKMHMKRQISNTAPAIYDS